jgi:hypothetical protein
LELSTSFEPPVDEHVPRREQLLLDQHPRARDKACMSPIERSM